MNKVVSTIGKIGTKSNIPLSQFKIMRQSQEPVLTIEIAKEPSTLFKNSLWVGYRNGGMASWLSTLMAHLPYKRFCLYMDQDAYKGSEYMYSYYPQYFSKLFHKQYVGTCIFPRKAINSKQMTSFNEIKANQLQQQLHSVENYPQATVLLDLRGSESTVKCSMPKLIEKYQNAEYINLPLNDEDLLDTLQEKTRHLPKNTQFVTLCAKGYRSLIGYSFLQHLKKPQWDLKLCRDPIAEVKEELSKPKKLQAQQNFSVSFGQLAFN